MSTKPHRRNGGGPGRHERRRHRHRVLNRHRARRLGAPEALERREMLSAAPWSFAEMRAALEPKLAGITGVTVITHGWQATDWGGDSLAKLSTAIFNAAERAGSDRTWLLDYDVTANRSQGVFDREQSRVSATNPSELILQWDWGLQ